MGAIGVAEADEEPGVAGGMTIGGAGAALPELAELLHAVISMPMEVAATIAIQRRDPWNICAPHWPPSS